MKKALLVALCLIAVGCMAVNGTFATDQFQAVSETITKAIGDVFATLTGLLGADNGTPTADKEKLNVSLSILPSATNELLYPGKSAGTVTTVQNKGSQSVYFRLAFAVRYDKSQWNNIEFEDNTLFNVNITFEKDSDYTVATWGESDSKKTWKEIVINDEPYMMQVLTYMKELPASSEASDDENANKAPAVTAKVSFKKETTDEQFALYKDGKFMKTQVLAIETESFTNNNDISSATDALDKALPLNNDFNPF